MKLPTLLALALLTLATPALAQPAGGLAPAIDPASTPPADGSGLILFGWTHRPAAYPIDVLTEQMQRQTTLLRSLLDVEHPDARQSRLFHDLHGSIFSVARYVLNERPAPDRALGRALLPYVSEDMARALKGRAQSYAEPDGPLGRRAVLYDVARAIASLARGPGGAVTGDRALLVDLLRGLVGAVPFEGGIGSTGRQFITRFEVHRLFIALYPQLPTSGGHRFRDYVDLTEVHGPTGDWIDGLATAFTLGGRRKNTARLLARIDELEAARP